MSEDSGAGRFAPSPTGRLHIGNLRTALVAWLMARSTGRRFVVRMEDLDRVTSSTRHEEAQLRDLATIGLEWDGPVVRQSDRFELHRAAIDRLTREGLTYRCWCTRREIAAAAQAPHGEVIRYPGTCRDRTDQPDEPFAIRLRADHTPIEVHDQIAGRHVGCPDDVVLVRRDGIPAYQLAVVVDDADQGVDQVVRADDLLPSTPSQVHLQALLGLPTPTYVHVPLVLGPDRTRLAKRHGAVTLEDLGWSGVEARAHLAVSLGLAAPGERPSLDDLLERFDPTCLPREPWVFP
jgi:glutamyl-tRNA synthetase